MFDCTNHFYMVSATKKDDAQKNYRMGQNISEQSVHM